MSFLTGQDRTPKFAGQVLPDWTESGLIFLNILPSKQTKKNYEKNDSPDFENLPDSRTKPDVRQTSKVQTEFCVLINILLHYFNFQRKENELPTLYTIRKDNLKMDKYDNT